MKERNYDPSFTDGADTKAKEVLKRYFGYDDFRAGQSSIINSLLHGEDALGIMPTGAGKSICYQVPALMMSGVTLVISPLISLMIDQVKALNQAGIHAAYLNSSLTVGQYYKALDYARQMVYKIIYVAPERLLTEEFQAFARDTEISMIAIDEAHCVSQWGQDFRPSYLKITEFIDSLPKRPIVSAFTATATDLVKNDIIKILRLRNPHTVVTGFDRKNLSFEVRKEKDKFSFLIPYLKEHKDQNGIIYCSTRKTVEEVTDRLRMEGFAVTRYHAGLGDRERNQNQDDFIYDKVNLMVATNAFGMGIDKSNVNFVIHYNMPKNLESYYQEAGRAGRDGSNAECILLYAPKDVVTNQYLIDLGNDNEELDDFSRRKVRENEYEKLKQMTFYCYTNDCLREFILRYFGEYGQGYCGNCSNCLTNFEEKDVTAISEALVKTVSESRERYGINVIIDTIRGGKNSKIMQFRMNEASTYGILPKESDKTVRLVVNHLLLTEYLILTNDNYPILKLGPNAHYLLNKERTIMMKMMKEEKKIKPAAKKVVEYRDKKSAAPAVLDVNEALFAELKSLRAKLASIQKVPAYIIFNDKTLTEMAAYLPTTEEEMLEINGVGAMKFEKYGQEFIDTINEFKNSGNNMVPSSEDTDNNPL
ncbi:MAG: DNA helicase RecQ [Lachnospiraceae bacterium]|nr:DNA helicase RecQ [Lachnospiraceae bacterium]